MDNGDEFHNIKKKFQYVSLNYGIIQDGTNF